MWDVASSHTHGEERTFSGKLQMARRKLEKGGARGEGGGEGSRKALCSLGQDFASALPR